MTVRSAYAAGMAMQPNSVGGLLRDWRVRRRLSQLALACEAEISARHLSFVENGRSSPSREMLLRLAETLAMPLRERNRLFLAAGYAPLFQARSMEQPDMEAARSAIESMLAGHEPFPALVIDRHWNLVSANRAVGRLLRDVDPALLAQPINVLRLSLSRQGLGQHIINLAEWRHHLLARLRADANRTGDPKLAALHGELRALPVAPGRTPPRPPSPIAIPLVMRDPATGMELSFISTTTVFGTAADITLSELTLECFYPADDRTRSELMSGD